MKKTVKIIALTLAIIMLLAIMAGCSLFGVVTSKYNKEVVMTVGNEKVTVKSLNETFLSTYYNYYSYVAQGYLTLDDVFEISMESVYETYSKVDKYKSSGATYTSVQNSHVGKSAVGEDMKYLTQTEGNYVVAYTKYYIYTAMDEFVEQLILAEIGELGTLTKDTSRDFIEYDEWNNESSYAEYLYNQSFSNDELEEYLRDYYGIEYMEDELTDYGYQDYVHQTEKSAEKRIENINKRLKKYIDDKDEEFEEEYPTINYQDLKDYQERAIVKYERQIKKTQDMTVEEYMNELYENIIRQIIVAKYNLEVNSAVEADPTMEASLKERYENDKVEKAIDYTNPDKYVEFIESLADDSAIYDIPEIYQGKYVFVKNLLIPFTDHQTSILTNFGNVVGTESETYKNFRNQTAASIVARDYLVEDEEDDNAYVKNLFTLSNGELVLNENKLSNLFEANSSNGYFSGNDQDFMDLMFQYNTDEGQHKTVYDYVVRIGETPESYTHKWVSEFVDATNTAWENSRVDENGITRGGYGISVSQFGIHIVYVSGEVTTWEFDINKKYDSSSLEYNLMKEYYNAKVKKVVSDAAEELEDEYRYGGKIEFNSEFKKYAKQLGIKYDFEKQTTKED